MMRPSDVLLFFFFNDTATTEIYTLSLHDALPISIGFVIRNEDQRSRDYSALADTFRPGHADYTYWQKYGLRDYRGGGRASARETMIRVAAGAIAQKWLRELYSAHERARLGQPRPNTI